MANIKIGNSGFTYEPQKANTTYILEEDKTLDPTIIGITSDGTLKNVSFEIDGTIMAPTGLHWGDMNQTIRPVDISIGKTGLISGTVLGVELFGDGHHIENAGQIEADTSIRATGQQVKVENSGHIEGSVFGIDVMSSSVVRNSGSIVVGDTGIVLRSADNFAGATVVNTGEVGGMSLGIAGSAGADRIVNSGKIYSGVEMRAGEDTFVFKGGKVEGHVAGGDGNDLFILKKAGLEIVEVAEEGYDTVKSSVSHTLADQVEELYLKGRKDIDGVGNSIDNRIFGNAGDNRLQGGNGFDVLTGGAGKDVMTGGLDGDTFVFERGSGKDIITDFEVGTDEIHLGGLKGATDFLNMLDQHIADKNGDLWITYGKDVIVLENISGMDLKADDFVF